MTGPRYYDRAGAPLTMMEWANTYRTKDDKVVKQEQVGDLMVSTVWLGLDHQHGDGPPLIFETMVLRSDWMDECCWRYSTEAEALAHHGRVVEWVRAGSDPASVPEQAS